MTSGRPNPLHYRFAERLRGSRKKVGLTSAGLSDAAGIGRTMAARLERGDGLPLLSTAEKLANVLGISPGQLVYGIAAPWQPASELRCKGLAGRLRQLRQELGLSLAEVGRRAGSSAAAVRSLEDNTLPTIATLEALAKALGVSPAWLGFAEGPRQLPKRGSRRGTEAYIPLTSDVSVQSPAHEDP